MAMSSVIILIDDFSAARKFVSELPDKIRRDRFAIDSRTGGIARWTPDHIVLVGVAGRIVAMADALFSSNSASQKAANASLVALEGFGGYAVRALLILKKYFPAMQWESTLVNPTNSTEQISRRYFDVTYDQLTWDISQELMQKYGLDARFLPLPIVLSNSLLKKYGYYSIKLIDITTKRQILRASLDQFGGTLISTNGNEMSPLTVLNFASEIVKFPVAKRQEMARLLLLITASGLGYVRDYDAAKMLMNPKVITDFHAAVREALR